MTVRPPSKAEIAEVAEDLGLHASSEDVASYAAIGAGFFGSLALLDQLPDPLPPVRRARTPGERPAPADNPLGAWYVKTRIEGASEGMLSGRSVALKDTVMLAGVPMSNGTSILDGYIPPVDATIVTRILDAGGVITGRAVCEAYCLSGGSHTSDTGPVRNPHDPSRSAGGSSSGSAALVAAGDGDLAIGGDQGGSIRMPSSFCGTVGMKPTHGLVPYTGVLGLEPTIDHVGPITANVADNALFLEVLAGEDGYDSRQRAPRVEAYCEALGQGIDGLRVALVSEGFDQPGGEPDVSAKVRDAAARLADLGAKLTEVSIPAHRELPVLASPIFQSALFLVLQTDGCVPGTEDLQIASYLDHHRGWRDRADDLPETVKTFAVVTEVMRRRYGWRYYAKAQAHMRRLRAAFDAVFAETDVLVMPTTPTKAPRLPAPDASREEIFAAATAPIANTQPFDHTHHPALSIPCGMSEGLPVGMMLVGRAWQEATLYRLAHAFEQHADWREL
jgi:amidase